ncbi:MAG: tetratricopeptide repeat protein [Puniceicoccaceae bacterium]
MSKDKKDPKQPELPPHLDPDSELPPDADIEERFNDFWKKNGTGIFGGIAIGAAIVIGIQLVQYFGDKKEESIREEFSLAATPDAKLEFAGSHGDHQLAALAQLQVADARYDEGAFEEAASFYAESAKVFVDATLVSRAILGQGMSLLQAGQTESGRGVLEAVARDSSALDQTRGEAAYHLAISHWEAGETEKAIEATDIILQLDSAPFWAFKANSLRDRLGVDALPNVDS